MSQIINDELVLTQTESVDLLNALINHNTAELNKRDQLLDSLSSMQIESKEKDTVLLHIPDFLQTSLQTSMNIKYSCKFPAFIRSSD